MSDREIGVRILIVDDDEVDRESVRRALRQAGVNARTVEASTGKDALELLGAQHFDCVFLDYNIPGSDGLALLRAIGRVGYDVPVVALTGHGDERVAVELMKAGAADYLAKGEATPERLASSLRYAIELARARARTERLQRLTARLAAVVTRRDVAELVVSEAREALSASMAWLALVSDDGRQLHAAAHVGVDANQIEQFSRLDLASELLSDTLRDGEPRWFGSKAQLFGAYPELHVIMQDFEQEACIVLPVESGGNVRGIMTLGFPESREVSRDEINLATALSQQCAQALERARLYDAERSARAEAERARRDAEEANRAKSEFLARMSHDLRTPLNAIAGYTQLIAEGVYGEPTPGQRDSLGRIRRAQQHLLTLINDVLSFAKLEAGQVHLSIRDVSVQQAFDALGVLIEPQARAKGVAVEVRPAPHGLMVRADPDRLTQILLNLLTNAVKFTDAGGRIVLAAESTSHGVTLVVNDTGRGIRAERLEAIFTPFVQGELGPEEQRNGVGLGLAIGRELARMMHGDLHATSVVGQGSTFTLTLPAATIGEFASRVEGRDVVGSAVR